MLTSSLQHIHQRQVCYHLKRVMASENEYSLTTTVKKVSTEKFLGEE